MTGYRIHQRKQRKLIRNLLILCSLVLLVGSIWYGSRNVFQSHTNISNAKASVSKVVIATPKKQHIDEPLFTFDLPTDWVAGKVPAGPYQQYAWGNTAGPDGHTRALSIYVDKIPINMAVTKLISVAGDGDHMTVQSDVSESCTDFTQQATEDTTTATAHAKWNGIDFICDIGGGLQDVVGTGSLDGVNKVVLTGSAQGKHSYFFVYTDNSARPDYSAFSDALSSFRAK